MTDEPREILLEHARELAGLMVQRLGERNVECIFVGGSTASGEVAWFRSGEEVEIYSDVDLYVVVGRGVDLEKARRTADEVTDIVPRKKGTRTIFPRADIGVYTWEDLGSQPARPGTVELCRSIRMIRGEVRPGAVLDGFAKRTMDRREALYLLENRLLEETVCRREQRDTRVEGLERYGFYRAVKAALDVCSAVLILQGTFVPGRERRMEILERENRSLDVPLGGKEMELVRYAFRQSGAFPLAFERERRGFEDFTRSVWKMLPDVWLRIAGILFGGSYGKSALVRARAGEGGELSALREGLLIARRLGRGSLGVVRLWLRARDVSPIAALRLAGFCSREVWGEELGWLRGYLGDMTALLSPSGGSIEQRAYRLLRTIG